MSERGEQRHEHGKRGDRKETARFRLMGLAVQRNIVASLDMKNPKVLSSGAFSAAETSLPALQRLNRLPLEGVILLELNRVGIILGYR